MKKAVASDLPEPELNLFQRIAHMIVTDEALPLWVRIEYPKKIKEEIKSVLQERPVSLEDAK